MKILVLSDTHSQKIAKNLLKDVDLFIHCGDYGFSQELLESSSAIFVRGNCDIYGEKYQELEFKGRKLLITHGDLENVKYGYDKLIYRALERKVSVCFFGHTHRQLCFKEEDILFLNPGAYPNYAIIDEKEISLYSDYGIKKIPFRW